QNSFVFPFRHRTETLRKLSGCVWRNSVATSSMRRHWFSHKICRELSTGKWQISEGSLTLNFFSGWRKEERQKAGGRKLCHVRIAGRLQRRNNHNVLREGIGSSDAEPASDSS